MYPNFETRQGIRAGASPRAAWEPDADPARIEEVISFLFCFAVFAPPVMTRYRYISCLVIAIIASLLSDAQSG